MLNDTHELILIHRTSEGKETQLENLIFAYADDDPEKKCMGVTNRDSLAVSIEYELTIAFMKKRDEIIKIIMDEIYKTVT